MESLYYHLISCYVLCKANNLFGELFFLCLCKYIHARVQMHPFCGTVSCKMQYSENVNSRS